MKRREEEMQELRDILTKYDEAYLSTHLRTAADINKFAMTFYKDAAEIYDCITRLKDPARNPTGFSLHDAPILGLLVRIWKLLKEIIKYYEADNAEIISVLERPLIEASVTATYLLNSDDAVIEDYRKCSYKDRLHILRDLEAGSPFPASKAGQRLLRSIREKMALEGLAPDDFQEQKKNGWRLQGRPFYKIFAEVVGEQLYASSYGMMSGRSTARGTNPWTTACEETRTARSPPFPSTSRRTSGTCRPPSDSATSRSGCGLPVSV
jgi:hypothetical protein